MSLNYAESLSPYPNKGKCGLPEREESLDIIEKKCLEFYELIEKSKHVVVITGAGISTSCGIPDFRGPNGVWTLEKKGKKPDVNVSFEKSIPSFSHYALVELYKLGKLKFLISQNIDGLHMKSGFPLDRLAELHGNMFVEKCNVCNTKYIREKCVEKIGLKPIGKKCTKEKLKGTCRGELYDTILDWDNELPSEDMVKSELNCKKADLIICLGSSLQIMPVGNYPLMCKKNNGKIVIVNLQTTRIDKKADLIIQAKLDLVFQILFDKHFKIKYETNIISIKTNSFDTNEKVRSENDNKLILNYAYCIYTDNESLTSTSSSSLSTNQQKMISNECETNQPHLILIFSGKRKSGKDYVCQKLTDYLQNYFKPSININLITLSAPLKQLYAQENNLDYSRLLDSSEYKEIYRLDMIKWSDAKREQDPFYFCQKAVDNLSELTSSEKLFNLWIITDARRKTDLKYFTEKYPNQVKTVRVCTDESTRIKRNWIFTKGVDDTISECDLDTIINWDFEIINNDDTQMNKSLEILLDYLKKNIDINC